MNEQTEHPENQPAFPIHQGYVWGGMSLRHWYAGLFMQSFITTQIFDLPDCAERAVNAADILIAELAKEP